MRRDGFPRENRTGFARIIANRDDEIEMLPGEVLPGFADRADRVDFEDVAEDFQNLRMHFSSRIAASAGDLEGLPANRTEQIFGHNTAIGIAGAEKKNSEFLVHRKRICP